MGILSGCLGGVRLMTDPSGASIDLPVELLEGSMFSNYFAPGLVLLIVLGIGPLLAAYGVGIGRIRDRGALDCEWARPGLELVNASTARLRRGAASERDDCDVGAFRVQP